MLKIETVWASGVALVFGGLLLALSVPDLKAYSSLETNPPSVERALKAGGVLSEPILDEAIRVYERAVASSPNDAVIRQDLCRLVLRKAELAPDEARQKGVLLDASTCFRTSIARAPSRAFPWSLEAYTQSELSAKPDEISNLIQMSYFLGPHEASSMLLRARTGSRNWSGLSADVQKYVSEDFAGIWRMYSLRSALVEIYLGATMEARIVIRQAVFRVEPGARTYFDRMVLRAASGAATR